MNDLLTRYRRYFHANPELDDETQGTAEYIENELARVFAACKALNSDAMRFGRYACMQFPSEEAWQDYVWKQKYKQMTAEFSVAIHLDYRAISAHME